MGLNQVKSTIQSLQNSFIISCRWESATFLEPLSVGVISLHSNEIRTYNDILIPEQLDTGKGVSINDGFALIPGCSNWTQVFVDVDSMPSTVTEVLVFLYSETGNEDLLSRCEFIETSIADMGAMYHSISECRQKPGTAPTIQVAKICKSDDGDWIVNTTQQIVPMPFESLIYEFVQD